jgi:hypothetical protein
LRSVSNFIHIAVFSLLLNIPSKPEVYGQDPVINEFMSRNDTTLQDQDGDYPDWIELYNPGEQTVDLLNYSLSDNLNEARKWIFPEVSIAPKEYLLLYASGKDRVGAGELHTNFKISSEGEPLLLTNQGGSVIDLVDSVELAEDQVLARFPDGDDQCLTSFLPTPGGPNEVNNQLLFSHKQGFYELPFHLEVSSLNGDTVRFTRDGSIPTDISPFVSETFYMDYLDSKPNFFSEIPTSVAQENQAYKAWETPGTIIDKIHVVRCASFSLGERTSEVFTYTYFVDSKVNRDYSMPVISISAEGDDLFGFERGIFVPGIKLDPENPAETGNYFWRGDNWERPVHIELFESDGTLGFSQDASVRVHGGLTRHAAQKSIRVYAREKYGNNSFDYPLLPQKPVVSYKRFLLRTTMGNGADNALIRDVLAHELSRDLNFEIQDYRPVVFYINGEYWGIHTLRDRIDEHYLEYSFGVDSDSVDIINANPNQVIAGTNESYMELAGFINTHDLSLGDNYEYIKSKVDVLSLVDYVVAEMFFSNWDWPGNNQKLWRSQKPDGKWRWIFFDLDKAYFGSDNVFERAILEEGEYPWNEEPVSSFLMRNLLKNEEFKSLFISRMAEILNEIFTPSRIYQIMNNVVDLYRLELPRHISRWHYPYSVGAWEDDIANRLLTFLLNRPCNLATEAMKYFDLEEFGYNCYTEAYSEDDLLLAPNPNNGNFYIQNNTPKGVLCGLIVRDNTGRIVHMEEEVFLGEFEKKHFDLSFLLAGVYYLNYSSINFPSYSNPPLSVVKPIVIY